MTRIIKSYTLPVVKGDPSTLSVENPEQYAEMATAIYAEIENNGGEVIAEPRLSVVFSGRTEAVAYMPLIVARFDGPLTSVGKD